MKQAAPREGLQKQLPQGTWPDAQCDPKPGKRRPHTAELRPADVTSDTSDSQTHAQGGDPRGKARASRLHRAAPQRPRTRLLTPAPLGDPESPRGHCPQPAAVVDQHHTPAWAGH